jgi:hypothetical protein
MIREISKTSGIRFVLIHAAEFIRWYAKRHNNEFVLKYATQLDDMVEEMESMGL